jgi:hypothetical protein
MDTHRILQKYVFMLVFKIRILLSLDMSIHTCGLSLDMRPDSLFGPVSPRMPYPKAKPLSFLYDTKPLHPVCTKWSHAAYSPKHEGTAAWESC